MEDLPEDVASSLVRGIGAYVRATPAPELTPRLRPLKRTSTPKALDARRAAVLDTLEDGATRGRILEWVQDGKKALKSDEREALKLACERPEGWLERLRALSRFEERPPRPHEPRPDDAAQRQVERLRRARDELRKERDELRGELNVERARLAEAERQISALQGALARSQTSVEQLQSQLARAHQDVDRERRRSRRVEADARAIKSGLQAELRTARAELRQRQAKARASGGGSSATSGRASPKTTSPRRGPRKPLVAPKGLLDTAPEALERWLETENIHLLVDGYNVAKAPGGFGDLELADQRDRLVDELTRLARRKKIDATVVFDGSSVPSGAIRRRRGPVRVEYSRPAEEGHAETDRADDHLIALLEALPPYPVVLATSDRTLQRRAQELGATIATAEQLLSLLR